MRGAAAVHKRLFERMLASDGVVVQVRPPAALEAGASAVDKFKGVRGSEDAVGDPVEYTALWTVDISGGTEGLSNMSELVSRVGRIDALEVVARFLISDILIDPDKPYGPTAIHTARDVVYEGVRYEITGWHRSGIGGTPYILYVGLRKGGDL